MVHWYPYVTRISGFLLQRLSTRPPSTVCLISQIRLAMLQCHLRIIWICDLLLRRLSTRSPSTMRSISARFFTAMQWYLYTARICDFLPSETTMELALSGVASLRETHHSYVMLFSYNQASRSTVNEDRPLDSLVDLRSIARGRAIPS